METQSIKTYLDLLSEPDREILLKMIDTIASGLGEGFALELCYGMPALVVPLSLYPKGYHAAKGVALPFVSFAKQKHHFALYVLFPDLDPRRFRKFKEAYAREYGKLDMGVGCLRLRKPEKIPYDLLADWFKGIDARSVIDYYETVMRNGEKGDRNGT